MESQRIPSQPGTPYELRNLIGREYALYAEYVYLCRNPVEEIFAVPSDHCPSKWHCVVTPNGALYEGAVFPFDLLIPDNLGVPAVVFRPPIYHPNVDAAIGELDLSSKIDSWSSRTRVRELLVAVKDLLQSPNLEPAHVKNPAAASLLPKDPIEFRKVIRKDITRISLNLTSPEQMASSSRLAFGPWNEDVHSTAMEKLLIKLEK